MKKLLNLKIHFVVLIVLILVGCTSSQTSDEASGLSEIEQETNKLESGEIADSNPSENSEIDLDFDEESSPDLSNQNVVDTTNELSEDNLDLLEEDTVVQNEVVTPPPAIEDELTPLEDSFNQGLDVVESNNTDLDNDFNEPPAPIVENDYIETPSQKVRITALDFKANENGGTIVIQASGPIEYTTEELTQNNQYVVEITNAILPKQFQRPYNAKEFSGPVGMISAQQTSNSSPARIVVQLKRPVTVSAVQDGNSLVLVPGAVVANNKPLEDLSVPEPQIEEPEEVMQEDTQPLATKTLDEFLMGDTKFYGKKISVEVSDGEIKDVINFISEESGVNLILSEEVKGKISVKLRQIPWDQALVLVMQSKQLGYIRQGNVLRIAPLASIRAETDAARLLLESQKLLEPLRVKVFPISYTKAKDMEPQATSFLSSRGSARADERTNSLVVKDIAENVQKIERLLKNLDTQTPQVNIEARIVETKSSIVRKIGVNWRSAPNSTGTLLYGFANSNLIRTGSTGLEARLDLLETDEQLKVLSAPSIVTLDNQVANIEQITQFPIYSETVDENGNVTRTVDFKSVKLSLNVTPQITADGGVILKTDLLREFPGAIDQFSGTSGARSINSRSAKTTILVDNGQTAVLGGIYQSDNTKSNSGIPFLRKIPILGQLFGQDNDTHDKNELLIFLTPRVLNKDKAFQVSEGLDESSNL